MKVLHSEGFWGAFGGAAVYRDPVVNKRDTPARQMDFC